MHIGIIGTGIVGVTTAGWLQRDGHRVTLIDRAAPASGCSYGNAGIIQVGGLVPLANPGILRQVPKMLLDPEGPLLIRWQYLPRLTPYLLRFIASARPERVAHAANALFSELSSNPTDLIASIEARSEAEKAKDKLEAMAEMEKHIHLMSPEARAEFEAARAHNEALE